LHISGPIRVYYFHIQTCSVCIFMWACLHGIWFQMQGAAPKGHKEWHVAVSLLFIFMLRITSKYSSHCTLIPIQSWNQMFIPWNKLISKDFHNAKRSICCKIHWDTNVTSNNQFRKSWPETVKQIEWRCLYHLNSPFVFK
jgi:hypothetical protein